MSTATIAEAPPAPSLSRLLQPKSIAIIGASNRMPSIGGYVTANILRAFEGEIYPVNPREQQVQGRRAYASVEDLPEDVDLAMIVVPADGVPAVLEACAARGVGGAVIITSGFAEVGGAGGASAMVAVPISATFENSLALAEEG